MGELENLVKSPAWDRLVKLSEQQIAIRKDQLAFKEDMTLEELHHMRGEIQGIFTFTALPEGFMESLANDIEQKESEVINDEN